jgi:predicted house-cleaning NTP pyrophosphatase (Maf/HAM1 superfamily)
MILPVLRDDQVVAIDGKTSRRSRNKADAQAQIKMLV